MSSLGMQMPGRQRVRPSGVNVYTGLMLGTVACLIGAIAFVLLAGMKVGPGSGVMSALTIHPEGREVRLESR